MSKSARAYTNDPEHPQIVLSMKGSVKTFATVRPEQVRLFGQAGSELQQTVTIEPQAEYPFKIVGARAQIGRDIRYEIDESKSAQGLTYKLTVVNTRTSAGRYFDTIQLETDNPLKRRIDIRVFGRIEASKPQAVN
jgi:hypothetical protein